MRWSLYKGDEELISKKKENQQTKSSNRTDKYNFYKYILRKFTLTETKFVPYSLILSLTRAVVPSPVDHVDRAKYDEYNNNLTLHEDITGDYI